MERPKFTRDEEPTHSISEVTTIEKEFEYDNGVMTQRSNNSDTSVVCECGEEFTNTESAYQHMEEVMSEPHELVKVINSIDRYVVESINDRSGDISSTMIDILFENSVDHKVCRDLIEPIYNAGYLVTGTHTGISGVDIRIWVQPIEKID